MPAAARIYGAAEQSGGRNSGSGLWSCVGAAHRMASGALKGSRADDHDTWVREGRLARITGETGSAWGKRIEPLLRVIPGSGVVSRRRKALVGWPVGLRRSGGPRRREEGLGEAGPVAGRRGARKKTTCRWARPVSPGVCCAGGAGRGVGRVGVGRCAAALAGSLGRGGWRARAVGQAGAVEWLGRDGGCCAGWAERVENGPWGRGEKGWAAQGFSWAGLVWGLGWVEFG